MQFRILNTHLCDIIKEQDNIESITLRRIEFEGGSGVIVQAANHSVIDHIVDS